MKSKRLAALLAALILTAGMVYLLTAGPFGAHTKFMQYAGAASATGAAYPDTAFAVLSDPHFYDTALGTSGAAYEEVLRSDRKLLADSEALLDRAIAKVLASDARFVLVSGDLTKDGEALNHTRVAAKLQTLVDNGIQVYVVPGNHDVNNYNAMRFTGDEQKPVERSSVGAFAEIYENMGYGGAIMRDTGSLSYVAEPTPGLWLLAVDSCRYDENEPGKTITGGRIAQGTAEWLAHVLGKAAEQDKAVMVLMHHGVIEHWPGQAKLHANYLVRDYKRFGAFLASYGVKLAFTGHYHAQSVVKAEWDGNTVVDVETGSLVTVPCPVRFGKLRDGVLTLTTDTLLREEDTESATDFTKKMIARETEQLLSRFVTQADAAYIAEHAGDAFLAHYIGDADSALQPAFDLDKLSLWGRLAFATQKYVLDGLWTNLPPEDNDVVIDLR